MLRERPGRAELAATTERPATSRAVEATNVRLEISFTTSIVVCRREHGVAFALSTSGTIGSTFWRQGWSGLLQDRCATLQPCAFSLCQSALSSRRRGSSKPSARLGQSWIPLDLSALTAWSTGRWCMSEKSDRFFSDTRFGTNRGPTVHPLRALD